MCVLVAPHKHMPLFTACFEGTCCCVYILNGVNTQLRPCRCCAMCALDATPTEDDLFILTGLCQGFNILDSNCELQYLCNNYGSMKDASGEMTASVLDERSSGKITVLDSAPKCVHSLGAIRRPDGKLRCITDCSRPYMSINDYMQSTAHKFKYSNVDDAVAISPPGGYGAVVDISSAYRSVNLHPSNRQYCGFVWDCGEGPQFYEDNCMCFGIKSACYLFNSITDFVRRYLYRYGVNCINYLDDFYIQGPDFKSCQNSQILLMNTLRHMGFNLNWKKATSPSHVTTYLGIEIDLKGMELRLPTAKLARAQEAVATLVGKTWCSRKELECVTGLLSHCATVVKGGRTFTRRLFNLLKATRHKRRLALSSIYKDDLLWWKSFLNWFNGRAKVLLPHVENVEIYTDSSSTGFGAACQSDVLYGMWDKDGCVSAETLLKQSDKSKLPTGKPCDLDAVCPHHVSPPSFGSLIDDQINVLELWPVLSSLINWGHVLRDSSCLIYTDNTQVEAMLATGRSKNINSMHWLREIFWRCVFLNIIIIPRRVSTHENSLADSLSRLPAIKHINNCASLHPVFSSCCAYRVRDKKSLVRPQGGVLVRGDLENSAFTMEKVSGIL